MNQPTPKEWSKFFDLKACEWLDMVLIQYDIKIERELMPFVRAIASEAFKAGLQFSADNTQALASGNYKKLFKEVLEYANRPNIPIADTFKSRIQ